MYFPYQHRLRLIWRIICKSSNFSITKVGGPAGTRTQAVLAPEASALSLLGDGPSHYTIQNLLRKYFKLVHKDDEAIFMIQKCDLLIESKSDIKVSTLR